MAIATLFISLKHNDLVCASTKDENGKIIEEIDSCYMPNVGIFGGDTTEMTIDNATGKIIGWIPITTIKDSEECDNE